MDKLLRRWEQNCALREYCAQELRDKLQKKSIPYALQTKLIEHLIKHGFIDERRYAEAFTNDHFQFNHWGKRKIRLALLQKKIPLDYIYEALDSKIEEEDYLQKLQHILKQKRKFLNQEARIIMHQKMFNFAYQRGFEAELIRKILREEFS